MDVDQYDVQADHLIVIDERLGRVAGTYRLLPSSHCTSFYSQSEFDLGGLF